MIETLIRTFLLLANIISLVTYGMDKYRSRRRGARIPESVLLLLAFFAPFGALTAMIVFRHKTRKLKFLLVPVFALLQVFLLFLFYGQMIDWWQLLKQLA